VAGFIGSPKMNFLRGKLVATEASSARVALQAGGEATVAVNATRAADGSAVTLGIRPEHLVHVADPGAGSGELSRVRGTVAVVENLGESALIYVRLPETDGFTLCRIEGTSLAREDASIELGIPPTAAHLFDAEGRAFPRTVDALPGLGERRAS
jgi:multiple sugar transport system ATP-binding protein